VLVRQGLSGFLHPENRRISRADFQCEKNGRKSHKMKNASIAEHLGKLLRTIKKIAAHKFK
jgi:hypothetical protein